MYNRRFEQSAWFGESYCKFLNYFLLSKTPSNRIVAIFSYKLIPLSSCRIVIFGSFQCWAPLAVPESVTRFMPKCRTFFFQSLSFFGSSNRRLTLTLPPSLLDWGDLVFIFSRSQSWVRRWPFGFGCFFLSAGTFGWWCAPCAILSRDWGRPWSRRGSLSFDSSSYQLMPLADGRCHVSPPQAEKFLVSTMPPRQSSDVPFGWLSKLSQKLGLHNDFHKHPSYPGKISAHCLRNS